MCWCSRRCTLEEGGHHQSWIDKLWWSMPCDPKQDSYDSYSSAILCMHLLFNGCCQRPTSTVIPISYMCILSDVYMYLYVTYTMDGVMGYVIDIIVHLAIVMPEYVTSYLGEL